MQFICPCRLKIIWGGFAVKMINTHTEGGNICSCIFVAAEHEADIGEQKFEVAQTLPANVKSERILDIQGAEDHFHGYLHLYPTTQEIPPLDVGHTDLA